jgi:hypothetical protein
MSATGGGRGSSVGGVEDCPWRATISASGSSDTNGSISIRVPESRAASEIGLKGVTITCEPSFTELDKVDLPRLCRRRTKLTIPITVHIAAAAPPMMPPAIAGVLDFLCDDDLVFDATPLAVMLNTGALREGPSQA